MKRIILIISTFLFFGFLYAQPAHKINEILEKNIEAGVGKQNLKLIKNYSFKLNQEIYYISCDGKMKIIRGKDPIITETILIDEDSVRRNSFNKITEFKGFDKAFYQCLTKLYSGMFTLIKFKDELIYDGLKKFGPEKLHCLTWKTENIEANFYLDSEKFIIKRIALQGYKEGEKIEINYDFGPFRNVNGMKIPSSWFKSQVGARGTTYRMSKIKINQNLPENFFEKLEINAGKVEILDSILKGNIIDFVFSRGRLIIETNWTDECFEKAGFESSEILILEINGKNIEITFYNSQPPRSAIRQGKKFIMPNRGEENYLIVLWSQEFQSLADKLSILSIIKLKRK
ncbi:hypothetical protein NLC29_00315 [Candidatus Aminicenantes bacterium AH-873-B07]|jgi:hypothetical protein|nr:hypothetical protein [Candidatus Aminicenantes bacterium AH-873-B07]